MNLTRRQWFAVTAAAPFRPLAAAESSYLPLVRSHLERLLRDGTDVYGQDRSAMWAASLDTRTGRYPEAQPMAIAGRRVYRQISAPNGSTIYWDQPQLIAAHALSSLTGDPRFARGATAYVEAFLQRGIDEHGLFQWGNHRYWDIFTDKVVTFSGGAHEIRPFSPAWQLFWDVSPKATEKAIRTIAKRHIFDPESGGFNRHDDGEKSHAFLEAGGVFAESLCWLSREVTDPSLVALALRIARYSYSFRNPETGLIENNPTTTRWDKHVSTTEAGQWAGSLLRAAAYTGRKEFQQMAAGAVEGWLRFGFDPSANRFYGQLRVRDGAPVKLEKQPGPTDYFPGDYSDIWNANFPTHDYPMAMAEVCLELLRRTGETKFREGVERWAAAVQAQPAPTTAAFGRGAYAESFGRAIHFLAGAGRLLKRESYLRQAHRLAQAARDTLFTNGMFRGHAGEDRYDAVDGVGYLLLALMRLETGRPASYGGVGF